jgi:dTMP kinase
VTPGRFVSLEGVDGSGKSTQARMLAAALRARGREVVETREPGGTVLGERLRALLLDGDGGPVAPAAEVHLFAAARAQLVADVVRPALARGAWVVCDRFLDSSLAYQGAGRGLGIDTVLRANASAVDGCLPHLTVLVDLPLAAAAWRREGRADRIEAEGEALQGRVAGGYAELARRFPGRIATVCGEGTPEAVHARVMALVDALG